MIDNILIRMPEQLDYFLAATAVVQDYVVQLYKQAAMKQRAMNFKLTVELPHEDLLFFWPLFPTMQCILREDSKKFLRQEWSCVLDFTDVNRTIKLATIPQKHITESWGIMFGASPPIVPGLGQMIQGCTSPELDVLIDERLDMKETLCEYLHNSYSQATVQIKSVEGLRPASLFGMVADTKIFIGMRGGATYLSAAMGKPTLEMYPDDLPQFLMSKPHNENYRMFYGSHFDVGTVWAIFEEMYCAVAGIADGLQGEIMAVMGGCGA